MSTIIVVPDIVESIVKVPFKAATRSFMVCIPIPGLCVALPFPLSTILISRLGTFHYDRNTGGTGMLQRIAYRLLNNSIDI